MFRWLKSLFSRPSADTLLVEGYWCESEITLPTKVRTPLGGKVAVITVCVDIHYDVEGDTISVRRVQLSRAGATVMGSGSATNVAAQRRGEAWYATNICPESTLKEAVGSDLAFEKSRLRRMMLAKWRDAKRGPLLSSLADAINHHAPPSEIERLVSTAGRGNDLIFTYKKPDGSSTVRKVTVWGVSGGSLRARDHKDGTVKSFRIERISDARPL
jgi:hypothetical protein